MKDEHQLGQICVEMQLCTASAVAEALSEQQRLKDDDPAHASRKDTWLGAILVRRQAITPDQLSRALTLQKRLRSSNPRLQAIATAELAEIGGDATLQVASSIKEQAAESRRRSGLGFPAVLAPKALSHKA
jgi:hypothetical protein